MLKAEQQGEDKWAAVMNKMKNGGFLQELAEESDSDENPLEELESTEPQTDDLEAMILADTIGQAGIEELSNEEAEDIQALVEVNEEDALDEELEKLFDDEDAENDELESLNFDQEQDESEGFLQELEEEV